MATPATLLESEAPVEERSARLESHVEHIQADISEMKGDIRQLKEAMVKLAVTIEKYRGLDRVWWLVIAATLLGVMAHGFKWL